MNEATIPEYRAILTADIEDYSSRTDAQQWVLQAAFKSALEKAADAAMLNWPGWQTQFSGDGIFAILPSGTNMTCLLDRFLRELDAELGGYNRRRREAAWTRMRLRLAVHAGLVYLDGPTGSPGQHAVEPARLCDSGPVRAALGACPGADLAVIVSSAIYRDYVTQGLGNPRPTEFRTVLARVKKQSYVAHVLIPGFDVHAIAALAKFDTSEAPPEGVASNVDAHRDLRAPAQPGTVRRPGNVADGARAGRDIIGRDSNRISGGGGVFNIGGDLVRPTDSPAASDER
jgi:class 3 adenylate cyclase